MAVRSRRLGQTREGHELLSSAYKTIAVRSTVRQRHGIDASPVRKSQGTLAAQDPKCVVRIIVDIHLGDDGGPAGTQKHHHCARVRQTLAVVAQIRPSGRARGSFPAGQRPTATGSIDLW
jgi:hypothetical protein